MSAVRRRALTIDACDRELVLIAEQLRTLPKPSLPNSRLAELREQLRGDADRWLEIRHKIAHEQRRLRAQGPRGL